MQGSADSIATTILALIGAGVVVWLLSKLAAGFVAAIDFMTRNE